MLVGRPRTMMLSCASIAVQRARPENMYRKPIILALFAAAAAARELPAQQRPAPPPGPRTDTLAAVPGTRGTSRSVAGDTLSPPRPSPLPGSPVTAADTLPRPFDPRVPPRVDTLALPRDPLPPPPADPALGADSARVDTVDSARVDSAGPGAARVDAGGADPGRRRVDEDSAREDEIAVGGMRPLAELGSAREERIRLAQLTGRLSTDGFLLRSVSTLTPRRDAGSYVSVLAPRAELGWNSRIPFSVNDGPLWAGKGGWSRVLAGVDAAAGPVRLVLAPELVWQQNEEFDDLLPASFDTVPRAPFTAPWFVGANATDLPYRQGDESMAAVFAGESSLTLRLGAVEAGAATESQWWGPGVRSALLLTNQAGGFPHLLLRTARPLRTPLGSLEARWIAGRLSSSAYDTASVGRRRSLSAAAVVLSPGAGVSVGAARVVYQALDGRSLPEDAADVFLRWRGAGSASASQPFEQMSSLFARWVLPGEQAEIYGELGRRRLPSFRDLLERPEDSQGYVLGFAWARPARAGRMRLSGEMTYLEKSPAYRAVPALSWYSGRAVTQGYTHRGQSLGSFVGPGASSQWLALDYVARRGHLGLSLTRVRWANDAYYGVFTGGRRYRGHDVSVLGTLRGALAVRGVWMEADWSYGQRFNFLFQNQSTSFLDQHLSVNPGNHTLRLSVSLAPPSIEF